MLENEVEQINRIDKDANVHTDAAVVTTDGDKKKVFDFIDFIENSKEKNDNLKKIRNLRRYITDDELMSAYQNRFGTISTEEEVISSLEEIFNSLADYVSNLPNGIVIDTATGLKDERESDKQAIGLGMADYKDYVDWNATDKFVDEIIKDYQTEKVIKIESLGEVTLGSFLGKLYYGKDIDKEFAEDINKFLYRKIEELNLSENLKSVVVEDRNIIKKSKYEHDMYLYKISKLEYEIEMAKGTNSPILEQLLRQRKEFYKEHSKYIGKVPIRTVDGELDYNEVNELKQFGEAYQREFILNHIEEFNGMKQDEFENYNPKEKEHFLIATLVSLGYEKNPNPQYREMAFESKRILSQLNPNLNINDKKSLEHFFKEQLNIKGSNANLEELIANITRKFEYAIDEYIMNDTEFYKDGNPDFTNFKFGVSSRINHDSVFENYFEGSKIKFNKNDEDLYNRAYRDSTIDAWIENKEDSIKLRYMALLAVKEEYEDMPDNTYAADKLKKINEELKKYDRYLGKIDVSPEEKEFFEGFKEQFVNAGIMKYLTRDAFEWQNGVNYNNLKEENKKGYIRNIIAALEYTGSNNVSIKKMALRRLELMNTQDKKFIEFDDNGEYVINQEAILEEYKKMSNFDYKNFGDLLDSVRFRKNEYLLTKLEEYTHLKEEDFLQLPDRENPIGCMKEIDRVRIESNQERIEGKKLTDDDIFAALGKGKVAEEEVDIAVAHGSYNINDERIVNQENQEEAGNNNDTAGSERKQPVMKLERMDVSGTQNKTPKFMDKVKNMFKDIKDKIKKIIKGEEETLELDSPKNEIDTNKPTGETNSIGYDINKQYNIDHNLANSIRTAGENTQKSQDAEVSERDN